MVVFFQLYVEGALSSVMFLSQLRRNITQSFSSPSRTNHTRSSSYQIFTLDKKLEWGSFWEIQVPCSALASLVKGPCSQKLPLLGPYPKHTKAKNLGVGHISDYEKSLQRSWPEVASGVLGARHLNYCPGYCQGSLHVSAQIKRRMILFLSLQMIACMIMCRRMACEELVMLFLDIGWFR